MDDGSVAPWAEGVDVVKKTDTDLEASRDAYTRVTDPERTLHRYVRTLCVSSNEETRVADSDESAEIEATGMSRSEVLDRGLRVGLADVIDSRETTITREQFDVAYTIPPAGWLVRQSLPECVASDKATRTRVTERDAEMELVDEDETDDMDRSLGFAFPSVVKEMAEAVIADSSSVETLSALVRRGCAILVGDK